MRLDDRVGDRANSVPRLSKLSLFRGTSQQSLLFRHALIQDAAYQSLLTRKRVHFHQPLGEGERVREVIGRLVIGGTLQRPFSCFHPIGQRQIVAPALGIVADGPERRNESLAARLRLAEALTEAGRFNATTTHYLVAAEQARQANDTESLVRVALGYDTAQFLLGVPLDRSVALLTEAEAKIARASSTSGSALRARVRSAAGGSEPAPEGPDAPSRAPCHSRRRVWGRADRRAAPAPKAE